MKTIKITIVIFILALTNVVFSQKEEITMHAKQFEINLKNPNNSKLKLVDFAGSITITANSGSKIIIEAEGLTPPPEKAKGLKRIGAHGEDNSGIGLNFKSEDNIFTLYGTVSMSSKTRYKISMPKNLKLSVVLGMQNNNKLEITGLNSDLELDVKNSDISLKDVTGPTVISSLSGDIDIIFAKVNQSSPFSIKSISGDIDISLPTDTPANLEMRSMNGGIYSDFDLKTVTKDNNDPYILISPKVLTQINNGGVEISIKAIRGNIYLRKKK